MRSFTSPAENILRYPNWWLRKNNNLEPVALEQGKTHGKGLIAKLFHYDDRDSAATLLKAEIQVPRELLPPLKDGEYYWQDLIGLQVKNLQGKVLGYVDTLLETGANDVMVVKGDTERLIPYVKEHYVKAVDLQNKSLLVDWPEEFDD